MGAERNKRKGQGSLEYVVLLSITIAFFIIVVAVASDQLSVVGTQQRKAQAQLALKQIADAATQVYQQGSGAQQIVSVTFPDGVDPGSGYISDNSLHVSFQGSDLSYLLGFPISGTFPVASGSFTIQLVSQGGAVGVGAVPFTINPTSLTYSFCTQPITQSQSQTLIYRNNQNASVDVNITTNWVNTSGESMSFSPSSFTLAFGSNQTVTVEFTLAGNSSGTFNGVLTSSATNYSTTAPIGATAQSCGGNVTPSVSRVVVKTYNDSTYTSEKTVFSPVQNVTITGTQWVPSSTVALNITNSSGSLMAGYPKDVSTDPAGTFIDIFDPSGLPSGIYTARATEAGVSRTFTFTLRGCT